MESELIGTVGEFSGYSFSTLDFVRKFSKRHPLIWAKLIDKYGEGGKGAGTNYSTYSYISQQLNKLWNAGDLEKLDYRKAPPEWGNTWIRYWSEGYGDNEFPNEITAPETVTEGARKRVTVNRYERDRKAKALCIEQHGLACYVCSFNFEEVYGAMGAGFIHVHHLTPISDIGETYELKPKEDLRPVCPNCHAMLHRKSEVISIEELKQNMTNL